MKIIAASHLDHGLTSHQLAHVMSEVAHLRGFNIVQVTIPHYFGTVPCGLHGPIMGDPPVPDEETTMEVRGDRKGPSRVTDRKPRPTNIVTVIMGPSSDGMEETVLYTIFGGPLAPREPWDAPEAEKAKSEAFWKEHALSR